MLLRTERILRLGLLAFSLVGLSLVVDSHRTFRSEVDWLFQTVFAAIAATLVSGAVAGRMAVLLRVSAEEEATGLDISEHGLHAYPAQGLVARTVQTRFGWCDKVELATSRSRPTNAVLR